MLMFIRYVLNVRCTSVFVARFNNFAIARSNFDLLIAYLTRGRSAVFYEFIMKSHRYVTIPCPVSFPQRDREILIPAVASEEPDDRSGPPDYVYVGQIPEKSDPPWPSTATNDPEA